MATISVEIAHAALRRQDTDDSTLAPDEMDTETLTATETDSEAGENKLKRNKRVRSRTAKKPGGHKKTERGPRRRRGEEDREGRQGDK
jgi:hypothetical protein